MQKKIKLQRRRKETNKNHLSIKKTETLIRYIYTLSLRSTDKSYYIIEEKANAIIIIHPRKMMNIKKTKLINIIC